MKKTDLEKAINGRIVADEILEKVAVGAERLATASRRPKLTVIIVGEDPASQVYVGMKVKTAERCGIESDLIEMSPEVDQNRLLDRIEGLNGDASVDGVLVQMPLPDHIDKQRVIESLSPDKDVDGLHPYNLGRLAAGKPRFVPCTPLGVMALLSRYGVSTGGKSAVIVGRSILVGRPMALLLSAKGKAADATVTICHSRSADMPGFTRNADILVAAAGSPGMIDGSMVKEGAVVIDVGTSRVEDPEAKKGYRLAGDVDFDSVYPKASLITPVPGGVGPMTVAMLMKNTLQAARWAIGEEDEGL